MAHRVFRLSITPERAPEVRRVFDFDGRATLQNVHDTIQSAFDLDDDHLYAFYLSGRYFDRLTEYGATGSSRFDARQSRLFRLGLSAGQKFVYLFDFGDELRHALTVVSIADAEAPLAEPVLVESVGEAPSQYGDDDDDDDEGDGDDAEAEEPYELPEHLTEVAPLAEAVLALSERLDGLYEEDEAKQESAAGQEPAAPPEAIVSVLRELSDAALTLATALEQDDEAVHELDEWSGKRELLPRLVELPQGLVAVGDYDRALAVAHAFGFVAPEPFNADVAIILAESGKRDEALAQLDVNLKQFPKSFLTAMKSGEAFEALGDTAAAEDSYRRAITLTDDPEEEDEAVAMLSGFLEEMGRADEIDEIYDLLSPPPSSPLLTIPTPFAAVGRNEPCPCGSGKKYKKCHGE
jgi:tetratricopeptide (TPR) repeat protein